MMQALVSEASSHNRTADPAALAAQVRAYRMITFESARP